MASTGQNKWQKYFATEEITTKVIKGDVQVYDDKGHLIDRLQEGYDITTLVTPTYNQRYKIKYTKNNTEMEGFISGNNVGKPSKKSGATENLGVRAETLILKGKHEKVEFAGQMVDCRTFSTDKELMNSILYGLRSNNKVSEAIIEVIEEYANTNYGRIKWQPQIADTDINELGKYMGELILGLLALKNNTEPFNPTIYSKPVKKFCVPIDPAFKGIDSFFILSDNSLVPVSSKFGIGAKASFFGNIMPKAMVFPNLNTSTAIGSLVQRAKLFGMNKDSVSSNAKKLVYEHAIRDIFKLNPTIVPVTYNVYDEIRMRKPYSKGTTEVLNYIEKNAPQNIKAQLPNSITAYMCRVITDRLNNDAQSINTMTEILTGKNYWQANLDIAKWKSGQVYYTFVNSGKASLKIVAGKAPISDITQQQGLINYELK